MTVLGTGNLVNDMRTSLFVLLIALPVYAWPVELNDYYGVWAGNVIEGPVSGKSHERYMVIIEFVPGKYTIDYPTLKCGGKLLFQGNTGRHFHFRDKLEYGKGQCALGGYTELLMISTRKAAFQWFDSNGVLRAKGMLRRERKTFSL
jgi:hypothetical protein